MGAPARQRSVGVIAGDPPIPTPAVTSPLLSFGLDLEPAVAGLPRGINHGQIG